MAPTSLIEIVERATADAKPDVRLTLPYDARQKSRQRARLDDGRELGIWLERGSTLRDGDKLLANDGLVIEVEAASETVTTAHAADPLLFARACYHLGNRHVPLQIGEGWLRFRHDHVLEAMLVELGLETCVEEAPFEPEGGAYSQSGHGHSHEHGQESGHAHSHSHTDSPGDS